MGAQSVIWFGIAVIAAFSGIRLLYRRYIARHAMAVQSRGSYTLFAVFMLVFAAGAFVAGLASL